MYKDRTRVVLYSSVQYSVKNMNGVPPHLAE